MEDLKNKILKNLKKGKIQQPIYVPEINLEIEKENYLKRLYMTKKLEFLKGEDVLDIGCNFGMNSFMIFELFGSNIVSIDIDREAIKGAKTIKKIKENNIKYKIKFKVCNFIFYPWYFRHKYIFFSHMVDSFRSLEKILKKIIRRGFKGFFIVKYSYDFYYKNEERILKFRELEFNKTVEKYDPKIYDEFLVIDSKKIKE
ncbi:MAG: methyltransferase domain-containing protein [archaeon]